MAIETKIIDLTNTEFSSEQEYAENTPGVFMNLLGGCYYDPVTNKYKLPPIKYSSVSLLGEKIRFNNNQEFTVLFSCLGVEYKHKKEVYNKWWEEARKLVDAYKEQVKIDEHIRTNNTDLKKLRREGLLLTSEELEKQN
jgi:hypothetical protein